MNEYKNRLTILGPSVTKKGYSIVKCSCGTVKEVRNDHIKTGKTLSCGCLRKEKLSEINTSHGMSKSSEYNSWKAMVHRCNDETDERYHDYGGRGISVCERWLNIENFIADIGLKPFKGAQIDRIDNSKGYYKKNCKWSTRSQNQRNMRSNRIIEYRGEQGLLIDFAEKFKINKSTLAKRIFRSGWTVEQALETKLVKGQKIFKEVKP